MRRSQNAWMVLTVAAAAVFSGCKSDFNNQLLERELRFQEDQIYQLQDELQAKCTRLDMVAAENQSLKKQLGIADGPAAGSRGPGPTSAATAPGVTPVAPPALVPPTIEDLPPPPRSAVPSDAGPRFGAPGSDAPTFRGGAAPPPVDGVPPLSEEPTFPRGGVNGTVGEMPSAERAGPVKRLSHEQSVAAAPRLTHLILNPDRTECLDGDGDGVSDAMAIVFEPRDADERLVSTVGDVSIAVFEPLAGATVADPSGEGNRIARWDIPAAEAAGHFRRTSQHRGLHFVRPWQGPPPTADHVRVFVRMTTFEGEVFETDATVPVR